MKVVEFLVYSVNELTITGLLPSLRVNNSIAKYLHSFFLPKTISREIG
jgi:hypothetical protein